MEHFLRREIRDGIHLNTIHEKRFKKNRISIHFIIPLRKETAGVYALLPYILRAGSQAYPDIDLLNRRLDELYGARLMIDISKWGNMQVLSFAIQTIDDVYALNQEKLLRDSCKLLLQVITDPFLENGCFSSQIIEAEKRNLVDIIEGRFNDKRLFAKDRCLEEFFHGAPAGLSEYGSVQQVKETTPEVLLHAWESLFKTAQIELFMLGNIENSEAEKLLERTFQAVRRKISHPEALELLSPPEEPCREIIDRYAVNQSKMVLGYCAGPAAPSKVPAMRLMNTLFGGSPHAKLFVHVRERLHLCYYCYSKYDKYSGVILIECGIEAARKQEALDEICRQLEDVKNGKFDEKELLASKMTLKNSYLSVADSLTSLETWYLGQVLTGEQISPADESSRMEKVTKEEIIAAAQQTHLNTIYFLASQEPA